MPTPILYLIRSRQSICMDRHTDRQAGRQTDRQTDRHAGRQTDRQDRKHENYIPWISINSLLV